MNYLVQLDIDNPHLGIYESVIKIGKRHSNDNIFVQTIEIDEV